MDAPKTTETNGFISLSFLTLRTKPATALLVGLVLLCAIVLSLLFYAGHEPAAMILGAVMALSLVVYLVLRTQSAASFDGFRAQLSALIDNPSLGLCIIEADSRITAINKTAVRLFGLPGTGHARQLSFWDLPDAEDAPAVRAAVLDAFQGEQAPFRFCRTFSGVRRHFSTTVLPIRSPDDDIHQLTIVVEDITEQRELEEAVRERERGYALAQRGANVGLWDWDMAGETVFFSDRWRSMLGYGPNHKFEEIDDWFRRVHPDDLEPLKASIRAHLLGDTPKFESEHRMKMVEGGYKWVLSSGLAARRPDGKAYRMAGSQADIDARRAAEERLMHDAFHDPLTGLPNRALFIDRLERAFRRRERNEGSLFAVLFLDLDRFKVVNDSLGHNVGDRLLTEVAGRLGDCVRGNDTVARLGGDEFTLLLEDIHNVHDATRVATTIHEQLSKPFRTDGLELFTSASIGISTSSPTHEKPEDVLRDADAAMYRAKTNGKARHEVFDIEMHSSALDALKLESELRRAFERDEFRLHYQPIVNLRTGRIGACEALVRWQHPERGLLSPGLFLPVVEDTGMMVELGEWVLRNACAELASWRRKGFEELKVSVNTSPHQYRRANLPEMVQEVLAENNLPPSHLFLELTEDQAMEDINKTISTLEKLRKIGVGISLDDFGTGYSSLSYLRRLPITVLKIAREFVAEITNSHEDSTIAAAILHLAHSLGLKVVAEGVESPNDLQYMIDHSCDFVQGYVFFPPLTVDEFTRLLSHTTVLELPKPSWELEAEKATTELRLESGMTFNPAFARSYEEFDEEMWDSTGPIPHDTTGDIQPPM